nr:hypothetical protein GCM10020093_117390 [Planobispora longispora]
MWQTSGMDDRMDDDLGPALDAVGPRLRALRRQRETTLADLSAATGISVSTLSRLESGTRRPTLELLLPWPGSTASRSTSSSTPRPPATPASTCARSPRTA